MSRLAWTKCRACSAGKRSRMASDGPRVRCLRSGPAAAGRAGAKAKGRKAKVGSGLCQGRSGRQRTKEASGNDMARKYLIETFGCQMNVHDSERMAGLLEQAGFEATTEAADADLVVINTCSVREHAEDKLYTRLGELRELAASVG